MSAEELPNLSEKVQAEDTVKIHSGDEDEDGDEAVKDEISDNNEAQNDKFLNPFDCNLEGDDCIQIRTKDGGGMVPVPYQMLVYMSDEFEDQIRSEDVGDNSGECVKKRFIDATEFTTEIVVKAISFHFPRFQQNQEVRESMLRELLEICKKWNLSMLKKDLQKRLLKILETDRSGIKDKSLLTTKKIKTLQLVDEFELTEIMNKVIYNVKTINFQYSEVVDSGFEKLSKKVKYELLKLICLNPQATHTNNRFNSHTRATTLELKSIFNFFDFLVYEDRVIDSCPKNDFKYAYQDRHPCYSKLNIEEFATRRKSTDVKLLLKDGELFVDPFILTVNSPVFDKMIQTVEDEKEKILNLQWKSVHEILMLLKFLTKFIAIDDGVDIATLASLCQEYKIEWLLKKIENVIENDSVVFSSTNTEKLLKYLKLASLYGFQKARDKLVQLLDESFITMQMREEFTWLKTSDKVLLARKSLWKLLPKREREQIVNTNGIALLSVLADHQQEKFNFESSKSQPFNLVETSQPKSLFSGFGGIAPTKGDGFGSTVPTPGAGFGSTTPTTGGGFGSISSMKNSGGGLGSTSITTSGGMFGSSSSNTNNGTTPQSSFRGWKK